MLFPPPFEIVGVSELDAPVSSIRDVDLGARGSFDDSAWHLHFERDMGRVMDRNLKGSPYYIIWFTNSEEEWKKDIQQLGGGPHCILRNFRTEEDARAYVDKHLKSLPIWRIEKVTIMQESAYHG